MTTENTYLCPILPLRDIVVFPDVTVPLFVGRDKSIKALEISMEKYKKIILVAQKNPDVDDPSQKDLYSFGTEGEILVEDRTENVSFLISVFDEMLLHNIIIAIDPLMYRDIEV